MSTPVIQFAHLSDGGRVAFHVLGKGPAVAMLFPYHVNHLTLNWDVPLHRGATEFLSRHFTVINMDFPGAGLSRPLIGEISLASLSGGLDAVRQSAGIEHMGLCAMGAAGLIACHFAVHYARRVTRLVFIASGESDANRRLLHLRRTTPNVEAQLRGAMLGGVGDRRNALALADVARASLDASTLAAWERVMSREKLSALTGRISTPAVYFHADTDDLVPLRAAEAMVGRLANATLSVVAAKSGMGVWRNRAAVREIVRFFETDQDRERSTAGARRRSDEPTHPSGLSRREAEVIRLIAIGRTNRQIAEELFISLNTVSFHLRNIFVKTGASNRTEVAAFAFAAGLAS